MKERDNEPIEVTDPLGTLAALGFPVAEIAKSMAETEPKVPVANGVGNRTETETIVDRVAHFFRRFVFLRTDSLYHLLALWTVGTHLHANFEYFGYIFACSPERQSGKSRLLEVLDLLALSSSGILVSPSEAVLFRSAKDHTQILDEVDGWSNRDELKNILKAGFRVGGTVPRTFDAGGGKYEVDYFSVYGPRALAGIGNHILDDATRDRTFVIEMVRQTKGERREQLRLRNIGPEADALKKEIEGWVASNTKEVASCYDKPRFAYLKDFRDRTIDVTEPLAAILEVCYKGQSLEAARSQLIEAVTLTRQEQESATDDHRILAALAELAKNEDPLVGSPTELAARCASVVGEQDFSTVSRVLRLYGFKPKSIRKDGGDAKYRYSLSLKALSEILTRYADDEGVREATS